MHVNHQSHTVDAVFSCLLSVAARAVSLTVRDLYVSAWPPLNEGLHSTRQER